MWENGPLNLSLIPLPLTLMYEVYTWEIYMGQLFFVISHLASVIVTLFLFMSVISLSIGIPYCRYTLYVARADTETGVENLAKYLANKASIKCTRTEDLWKTFIPAARRLGAEHAERRMHYSNNR